MKCSKCQAELLPGVSFCRECGQRVTPQVSFCRNCGNKVEENSLFCSKCGTKLLLPEQNNADNPQPVNTTNSVSQPNVNPDNRAYTSSSPSQHGVDLRGNNTAAPSDEFSDKLKRALLKFWNSIDTFCKAVTVFSVVVVLLLVGALIANKNYPIIISVIQALALTAAVLLHKNVIKVNKSWIKYIVLVGTAALTVLNIKSFSFEQKKEEIPQSSPSVEQDIAASTEATTEAATESAAITSAEMDSQSGEQVDSEASDDDKTQEGSTAPIETAQEVVTSAAESSQKISTSLSKSPQKNGFSPTGNIRVIVGNYVFDVPSYWKSDIHENDLYRAYAETSGKVAMLEISANYDEEDPVTYDILKKETDEGLMAIAIESMFDECHLKITKLFDNGKITGFVYYFDFTHEGLSGTGSVLYYPSESDNKWMSVCFTQTDNTEYSYDNDVEKIMKSITPKATYSENISVPTTQSSGNYTVNSCNDLAKILSMKETLAPEYSDFATKYRGAVIEFDASVVSLCNHGNYNNRYDLLISAGNYDPNHQIGPNFKFEDVSMSDMNADDTIRVGDNVRIEAKVVKFDSNSELFYLDPVSVTHR